MHHVDAGDLGELRAGQVLRAETAASLLARLKDLPAAPSIAEISAMTWRPGSCVRGMGAAIRPLS